MSHVPSLGLCQALPGLAAAQCHLLTSWLGRTHLDWARCLFQQLSTQHDPSITERRVLGPALAPLSPAPCLCVHRCQAIPAPSCIPWVLQVPPWPLPWACCLVNPSSLLQHETSLLQGVAWTFPCLRVPLAPVFPEHMVLSQLRLPQKGWGSQSPSAFISLCLLGRHSSWECAGEGRMGQFHHLQALGLGVPAELVSHLQLPRP